MNQFLQAHADLSANIDMAAAAAAGDTLAVKIGTALDAVAIAIRQGQQPDDALAWARSAILDAIQESFDE